MGGTSSTSDGGSGATGAQGGGGAGAAGGMGGMGGQGGTCVNQLPNEEMPPATLSQTGLYSDIATRTLSNYVQEFEPQYPLWTDTAAKTRWIYLPECNPVIDNTDEDIWQFPVGTRVWKQFERDGTLIETRLIHRWGPGQNDWTFAAYKWNDLDTEADHLPLGELDAKGTEHDIPDETACKRCHGTNLSPGGTPSRILGASAIQLSHSGVGLTMASLSANGNLMVPNAAGYTVPGNDTERLALGYLHANCGNCHNSTDDGWLAPSLRMRVLAADTDVTQTRAYTTMVDVAPDQFGMTPPNECDFLVDGGSPSNSCVSLRMHARGPDDAPGNIQMPPLGTQDVDTAGAAAVDAWITSLP